MDYRPAYSGGYDILVRVVSAKHLYNVKLFRSQSPFVVACSGSPTSRFRSSTAPKGGTNPTWNHDFLFREEAGHARAMLSIALYHQGKSYDKPIGTVDNLAFSDMKDGHMEIQVRNPKGYYQGVLNLWVQRHFGSQQNIEVTVHCATQLKNVKSFFERISFPFVRKMSPYVVVPIPLSNDRRAVSVPHKQGGKNPYFNFSASFTCDETLLVRERVSLKIELHHRHKAEINTGTPSLANSAFDMLIGTVQIPLYKGMPSDELAYDVRTPKAKARGKLFVSVKLRESENSQPKLPRLTTEAWQLSTRPPKRGIARAALEKSIKAAPVVAAGATILSTLL